jgi:hypothetical protein
VPDVYAPTTLDRERARLAGSLPPAQAPGPGFFESIGLGVKAAGAGPDWGFNQLNYEGHVLGDIRAEAMKRGYDVNAADRDASFESDRTGKPEWQLRANRLLAFAAQQRAQDPNFLPSYAGLRTYDDVAALARQRRQADLGAANHQLENGSGAGQLVGDLAHGFVDPINYLPIGGGPARGAAVSIGRHILTRVLWGAGANAAIAAGEAPFVYQDAKSLGIQQSAGDIAENIAFAGALGGGLTGLHAAGSHGLGLLVDAYHSRVPAEARTPTEQAAANVVEREAEVQASSPFVPGPVGDDAHTAALADAQRVEVPPEPPGPQPSPTARAAAIPTVSDRALVSGEVPPNAVRYSAREIAKAHMRTGGESRSDTDTNPLSSASGRYQFTYNTWLSYYRRRYGGTEGAQQIWNKRFDGHLQEVLEDDLLAAAGHALRSHGFQETPGSLYLIHFAGEEGGLHILRSDPATPIENIMSADAIARNKFLRGKTTGEVVAWADRKMGGGVTPHGRDAAGISESWYRPEEVPAVIEEPARVAFADNEARPDGLHLQDRPNLRTDLFATPEEHAAAQVEIWREHDARDGFATVTPEAPTPQAATVGADAPPPVFVPEPSRPRRYGAVDVMQAVADAGGIADNEGHSLTESRNLPRYVPGAGEIIKAEGKGGKSVDAIGEHLWQQGYFGPPETTRRPSENQVLQMVERAAREKVYRPEEAAAMAQRAAQRAAMPETEARFEIQSHAADHGVTLDPQTLNTAMEHRAAGETVEGAVAKAVDEARFRDLSPPPGPERFDDPSASSFADLQIDSLEHDLRMASIAGDAGVYEIGPDGQKMTLAEMLHDLDADAEAAVAAE